MEVVIIVMSALVFQLFHLYQTWDGWVVSNYTTLLISAEFWIRVFFVLI